MLSGFALLILVYYFGGLVSDGDPNKLSNGRAIAAGLATIVAGWLVYDFILARNGWLAMGGGLVLIMFATWGLTQVMSARSAFMHVGAMLGTLMALNVANRIIPAQKQMVRVATEGGTPDPVLAERDGLLIAIRRYVPDREKGHLFRQSVRQLEDPEARSFRASCLRRG
jgi:uncharacterized membrane protein